MAQPVISFLTLAGRCVKTATGSRVLMVVRARRFHNSLRTTA